MEPTKSLSPPLFSNSWTFVGQLVARRLERMLSIRVGEWALFATMFSLVCLVHLNFWILRSLRSTVAVADRGGAAELIPFFELWAALPASIVLTWGMSRLMRRFPMDRVFYIVTTVFMLFFILYAIVLYPYSQTMPVVSSSGWGPDIVADNWVAAVFYVMSEMWKVALLSLLFWGYANRHMPMEQAKRFYAPLLLGGSAGALLAGPITMYCTAQGTCWQVSIYWLLAVVVAACLGLMLLFFIWTRLMEKVATPQSVVQSSTSLGVSLATVFASPYLRWLGAIVVLDYLAYTLAEVVFLGVLKEYCGDPRSYCHYMGQLTFWSGLLTAISALWVAPMLLERCRWGTAAMVLPLIFMATTLLFFTVVCCRDSLFAGFWLPLAVAIGSVKHCVCRAAKFTLFDTTRELAYIPLPKETQMRGKLVIDGMGARSARALSSVANIGLITVGGGFISGAGYAGGAAIAFGLLWIVAVRAFDGLFEGRDDTCATHHAKRSDCAPCGDVARG